jgi:DNA-binding NarL/FixJ family response regulator
MPLRPDLDPLYIRKAFSAGAVGYVSKCSRPGELNQAIEKVCAGGRFVSPSLLPS